MSLSDIAIRRPVLSWMVMIGLIVFGWVSFTKMGVSQLPNIDFPVVSVSIAYEGAAPEVIEKDVVDVVEQALMTVQGVKEVASTSRQGQGSVSIELELDRDIDVAVQEIQTKINEIQRRLPKDIDPPIIRKQNPAEQPIVWVSVRGDLSKPELMKFVEKYVADRFSTISGVGEVILGGFIDPNLRVWIDIHKLNTYELTVADVMTAIEEGHSELPAGRIETSRTDQSVRVMGEAKTVQEFENIQISKRSGKPIYVPIFIKDVARIEDGLADVNRITRFLGKTSVGLGIKKQAGANEVAVAKEVKERLKEVKKTLPSHIEMSVAFDRSKFIEESVHELVFTLFLSGLVTALVCWLFIGTWSATVNILLAIPTAILGTFIGIYFFGFTLNTFTLLALSLAVGLVVDDDIMVLENIVRFREQGDGRIIAAQKGANQITGAAISATLALIAIFIPVAFISGVTGKLFFEFGVTIAIAVVVSLLSALMLTPMRCSQFLQVGYSTGLNKAMDTFFRKVTSLYQASLSWALQFKWLTLLMAFLIFIGSLGFLFILKKEFVPPQDQSMFLLSLRAPAESSLQWMDEQTKTVEDFIMKQPSVSHYFASIGSYSGGESNRANIFIVLKDLKDRAIHTKTKKPMTQNDLMAFFRQELNKSEDLKVRVQDLSLSGFSAQRGYPVEFSVRGPDWDKLVGYVEHIQQEMGKTGLMVDIDDDYQSGANEIRIVPDREKAEKWGVSMQSIGVAVNALIGGVRVGKYSSGDRRYDVRIRLEEEQRGATRDIESIWVVNQHGERVALKEIVHIEEKKTALTITRRARERSVSVFANIASGQDQTKALKEVENITKRILPEPYRAVLSGSAKTFQESSQDILIVFVLGIFVAYMVLASQYNSFLHPLIVLLALPFSISGAFAALFIGGQSLNMYSLIGIILLMGIVKKNSILLVDFTNQVREEGKKVHEALLIACPIRLRPIVMTSLSTIAAALPPALALGPGAEVRIPMAMTVIGGVLISTLFTLFVVPCFYQAVVKDV